MRNLLIALLFPVCLLAAPKEAFVVHPTEREITDHEDFVGRTDASQTVEIRSRVSGYLQKVLFKEGSDVQKGEILFQLDDRTQKAGFDQAKAELLQSEAKLKQVEVEYTRVMRLEQLKVVAKEEIDKLSAELEAAKATILAIRAKLELAKLNMDATQITAPIAGRIGRKHVDEGNLVKGSDTLLATVVVANPLSVLFEIPERELLRLIRKMRDAKEAELAVEVRFAAHEKELYSAKLNFLDNRVDAASGMITARATLANPKGELVPGLYAKVRVVLGPSRKVLTIPETAFLNGKLVSKVLVVGAKNHLEERELQIGKLENGKRIVEAGLKLDDKILVQPAGHKAGDEVVPVLQKNNPMEKPGSGSLLPRSPSNLPGNGLALIITTSYPGANADETEQVVAAPIVEQLRGQEGVTHQFVECTETGEVRITLGFKKGTDMNQAQLLTQNRVALALPALPEVVIRLGIAVKKRPVFLLSLALLTTDGSRDRRFLAGYADLQIRDELSRVAGVADVAFLSDPGLSEQLQIKVDRERLARFGVSAAEVTEVANEQLGGLRRIVDAEKLGDLVIKATKEGQMIRLKDVARIEAVSGTNSLMKLDGKPCVTLLVSRSVEADAASTLKAVREQMEKLKKALPEGLELRVVEE